MMKDSEKRKSSFRSLLRLLCAVLIIAALPAAAFAAESIAEAPAEETHVVIIGTSDMHGNIWGWSYEDGAETDNNGMARLYSCITQIREENPVTFLVDAGDDLQGTILSDDIAAKNPDDPNPVIAAMNYMGYDAMTLGNHEFNWGVHTLLKMISTAEFPVLAQNVRDKDGLCLTGNGWRVINRGGVRLAVIGVVTPDIPIWDGTKEGIEDLTYEAADAAVKEAIEEIGDQADIIMVSAHMGMESEFDSDGGSDSARKILENNPEIDVLQVGHYHISVAEKDGKTVIGGVRNSGRELARFDLTLDAGHHVIDSEVTLIDMADYTSSEEIREIPAVRDAHEKTLALVRGGGSGEDGDDGEAVPLGTTTAKFQPENEIEGLPEGKLQDTAVIDLILNIQLMNSGADVTSCALFRDTSDLPEGDIFYNNIFNIYKYDNTLYRLTVTGAELKAYMEWSAKCYNQWVPGDINISFDPDYPGYLLDMFAGVDYEINLSKPKGERIENVMFHGEPLRDDQTLTLAVNNYRYASAIKTEGLAAGDHDWESSNSIRDMIVAYFEENSPVEPKLNNNWKITGVDLSTDDPRRAELIGYINEGALPVPYDASYNLADYDELVAQAEENLASGAEFETDQTH